MDRPHALTGREVVEQLAVDEQDGLTTKEAQARYRELGANRIDQAKGPSTWRILIDQLRSTVVVLLVLAAAAAFAIGKPIEGVAVLVVLVVNTIVGFVTELRAMRSIEALDSMTRTVADVERDGRRDEVDAEQLVPGDIVALEAGDAVPADIRLLEAEELRVEEAALTGESEAVFKNTEPVDPDAALGDRSNMAFMGTTVLGGRGRGVVVATGNRAVIGQIAEMTSGASKGQAPLQAGLERLSRVLTLAVIVLAFALTGIGLMRGLAMDDVLEVSIALAVAIVPEGLPAVATLTLAVGMARMARRNALVRRLPVVETLGSTTVIASDKTGTLTRNEMTVADTWVADGVDERELWTAAVLCNDADIAADGDPVGDPTEVALLAGAEAAGVDWRRLREDTSRTDEIPFDSSTKRMAVLTTSGLFVKGAPEVLLADNAASTVEAAVEQMAGRALRVLAIGRVDGHVSLDEPERVFNTVELLGIVGLADPPRPEALEAVRDCRRAGVRVVMVTGDQPRTAMAIGREFGLREGDALTGRDLDRLDDEELAAAVTATDVFARVQPDHKLRIVKALQSHGEIVAVTGDGVNDAPALSQANVGVAMGRGGTEVARQAADIVLTDDNFATITHAVAEGRRIFANVQRFGRFIFSWHLGVTLIVTVAMIAGTPAPLVGLMVLWNNLVIDVLPSFALALEPSADDAMRKPPRPPREPVIGRRMLTRIATQAVLLAGVGLTVYYVIAPAFELSLAQRQTMTFVAITAAQLLAVFNARTETGSGFTGAHRNPFLWGALSIAVALEAAALGVPPLRDLLGLTSLPLQAWGAALAISLLPLVLTQATRIVRQAQTAATARP
ncbi:HAD-IC family P-type ATPase [uncultured Aeromicrobium sp.]|uniref:cation-translocating P-type ATPase n=1 Tax=uncultured Aeromicrobium sp. TaxID=337820 RepID=UPI0025D03F88|nr:HAD-IC family P-type ATPase [uncultured Aeromicrobium sp.]